MLNVIQNNLIFFSYLRHSSLGRQYTPSTSVVNIKKTEKLNLSLEYKRRTAIENTTSMKYDEIDST